jgi:hypothetical protein
MGHQARSASGGRSYLLQRHAERLSMPMTALIGTACGCERPACFVAPTWVVPGLPAPHYKWLGRVARGDVELLQRAEAPLTEAPRSPSAGRFPYGWLTRPTLSYPGTTIREWRTQDRSACPKTATDARTAPGPVGSAASCWWSMSPWCTSRASTALSGPGSMVPRPCCQAARTVGSDLSARRALDGKREAPRTGYRAGRLSLCWKLVGPWSGFVSRAALGTTRLALVGGCNEPSFRAGLLLGFDPG